MIGAISLHFWCVPGPETHDKCNEIAPIIVHFLHNVREPLQSLCIKLHRLVQFRFIIRAFQGLNLHQSLFM